MVNSQRPGQPQFGEPPSAAAVEALLRIVNQQLAAWGAVLGDTLAMARVEQLSVESRQERLQLVAQIEAKLDDCLLTLEAALTAADRIGRCSGTAIDNAAEEIRDQFVRVRVALRAPDRDQV